MIAKNEKELAQAIESGADEIIIEVEIAGEVIKIKAVGKVAWLVAVGAIGVAVVSVLAPTPPTAATGAVGITAAAGILGTSATTAAISIAVAAGGVGVLNKLRGYDMEKLSDGRVKLTKK